MNRRAFFSLLAIGVVGAGARVAVKSAPPQPTVPALAVGDLVVNRYPIAPQPLMVVAEIRGHFVACRYWDVDTQTFVTRPSYAGSLQPVDGRALIANGEGPAATTQTSGLIEVPR